MLYLHYSMLDFKAGDREAPRKMRTKVKELISDHGEGAVEALLHYYGSQQ
jgi:sulfide dehydrogenase cytochrome subunit